MTRTDARAIAMKLLYEWDMGGAGGADTIAGLLELPTDEDELWYARILTDGVRQNAREIDARIEKYARGWTLDRMARVDLAILRLSVYEMLLDTAPFPVIISEAMELAGNYSTDRARSFINGVLGNMSREGLR